VAFSSDVLPERAPTIGELVHVRARRWLVERVLTAADGGSVVSLACADDDAQGEELEVFWDYEIDRRILEEERWQDLAARGFDDPRQFAAYLNTLRWNTVTATEPNLFQAPFRAGITIDAYQMEPLRKALRLPRVNLFIADDTGLGKTIEAGLIARELLLRKKVKTIVVAAPPSVLEQWKAELDERFGLVFEILDRRYVAGVRRERGFGVNPWETHSRFLVSHNLLTDPTYADPMRAWLGTMKAGSMLILDEAHHAAPSSGGRYGIETKFTRAVRDLGARFEHRLFLSATPHNGHSNSFSTLLELLDPTRFTRGVRVRGKKELEAVMVRRLKEDIREIQGGFPQRDVVRIEIGGLPDDAPELALSRLLDEYRGVREQRFADSSARTQASAGLLVVGLQQRLLSSIEAFARSLATHRATVERHWAKADAERAADLSQAQAEQLLLHAPGADDEEDEAPQADEDLDALDQEAVAVVTEAVESAQQADDEQRAKERALLDRMEHVAGEARHRADAKDRALIDWIRANMCPGLPELGRRPKGEPPQWNDRRVLIFTESREGTKRHLLEILDQAIAHTEGADDRIAVITGLSSGEARREIQRRFNTDPAEDPLRILIATDAAREGLNFQAHCADLFHFDLPWNPGRIEQRNGRIDRKLQPADTVRCHYFVLTQRIEDRVLEVLVRKTETIKRELGSLSKVIDDDIERRLVEGGIRHADAAGLAIEIEAADLDATRRQVADEELEQARERQDELREQIDRCRTLLERSRGWVGFASEPFRDALDCSLELLNTAPLTETTDEHGRPAYVFPPLDQRAATDPSWAATLDTLRAPRRTAQKVADWRREAPIRPVVFEDSGVLTDETVHLHLEQRVAQRLLSRFRSQGFVFDDLSRAALAQVRDSIPRVVLLGRLSLYGAGAERLHEELVPVAARWIEPERRDGPLTVYAKDAAATTLALLEETLSESGGARQPSGTVSGQLLRSASQDVAELLDQLEARAAELAADAERKLSERGEREASDLRDTLTRQRKRVQEELERHTSQHDQLSLGFDADERRQLELNVKSWGRRLDDFEHQLESEPQRLADFYVVKATRVEPVGLVYLWPDTN
jgi:superfamily II DNA or RNA helicase